MRPPDGTDLDSLGLISMTIIPRGGYAGHMVAWFWPWARIVAPISDAQREELAEDGLMALPLLHFNPYEPRDGLAHTLLFGVGVRAE